MNTLRFVTHGGTEERRVTSCRVKITDAQPNVAWWREASSTHVCLHCTGHNGALSFNSFGTTFHTSSPCKGLGDSHLKLRRILGHWIHCHGYVKGLRLSLSGRRSFRRLLGGGVNVLQSLTTTPGRFSYFFIGNEGNQNSIQSGSFIRKISKKKCFSNALGYNLVVLEVL